MARKKILVLGAGVSGLTTAHELIAKGHDVTVIYEKDASETVSVIAGALWEYPPAVCGHHTDSNSLKRSKGWSLTSYKRFQELSKTKSSGVVMDRAHFYFHQRVEDSDFERSKMEEFRSLVEGFSHDENIIGQNQIGSSFGLVDAYSFVAPIINTPIYTCWLRQQLVNSGVHFVRRTLPHTLADNLPVLEKYGADILVNCAGLGALSLTDDKLYPLRGALVQLDIDPDQVLRGAHCITHDDAKPQQNMIYIIPRGKSLLLGGIAEPDQWDDGLSLEDSIVTGIIERCQNFMPSLGEYIGNAPMHSLVGLRPARHGNVRLEHDPNLPVIHNYGHGGSGYSFSWGCAQEVASLI